MDQADSRTAGTVLIVSRDEIATNQVSNALREHGLSVEVSLSIPFAVDRISRHKFEAVVVDLSPETEALNFLGQIRTSRSNRTVVVFALTSGKSATARALKSGFSFVLERPLSPDSINHTLKVAYGLIIRERRRYFRFPIVVPVVFNQKAAPEVYGRTVNVSEQGMAVRTSSFLQVGSEGSVQFTLQDPPLAIAADSRVCWSNDRGEAGLLFLFLPHGMASELQAWLTQKLEAQLPQSVVERFR